MLVNLIEANGLAAFKSAYNLSKLGEFIQVTARVLTDMAEYYQSSKNDTEALRYNKQALTRRQGLRDCHMVNNCSGIRRNR